MYSTHAALISSQALTCGQGQWKMLDVTFSNKEFSLSKFSNTELEFSLSNMLKLEIALSAYFWQKLEIAQSVYVSFDKILSLIQPHVDWLPSENSLQIEFRTISDAIDFNILAAVYMINLHFVVPSFVFYFI